MVVRSLRGSSTSFFGFGSVPAGIEDARGFIQQRIALFLGLVAAMSAGFFLVNTAAVLVASPERVVAFLSCPDSVAHGATTLLVAALWLVARAGSRSELALHKLDALSTIAVCAGYAMMLWRADTASNLEYVVMMATHMTLVCRAALVPSTARRTVWVSVFSFLPALALGYALHARGPLGPMGGATAALGIAKWDAAAIALTSVVSSVIYGLQRQVQQAMQLGQYTLEERIGEGGMGTVYKARHALLRRPTAIKLLPPEKSGQLSLARFEREVQLTSELTHPNTIAVYDFGRTPDGVFYYAMEFLDGLDLQTLVELHGPQSPARAVHILVQVCGALIEAHGLGLIHRDIKPANIFLCERGASPDVVKVLDFGLVKSVGAPGVAASLSDHNTITGTPLYLSPESITSPDAVDGRSDLYAVGAVGYFLLTGQHVFERKTLVEVCAAHLHDTPVPPSERLGKPLPADLEAVLERCLAKDPAARPTDARALRDALRACAGVAAWDEGEARAFWAARDAARARQAPSATPARPVDPNGRTVAVDFTVRHVGA